jgi:hypothetical protein
MITDEMVEWAAEAIWQSEPVRSGGRRRTLWPDESDETRGRYWPLARAALEAVLPMIRAEVLEEAAKVADEEANAWRDARDVAEAIRALKGGEG